MGDVVGQKVMSSSIVRKPMLTSYCQINDLGSVIKGDTLHDDLGRGKEDVQARNRTRVVSTN